MSRLAGLAKNLNNGSSSENSSQESGTPSSTSSLAALAAGTRPRQSLSSLAGGARLSSSESRKESSNTTGRPSLQDLARGSAATGTNSGLSRAPGGLTRLASPSLSKSSGTTNSSTTNDGLMSASSRPSLSSLAQNRDQPSLTKSPLPTSTPSLTQLAVASQSASVPRRSLAGLAKPSTITSAQSTSLSGTTSSSQPSVGLTPRAGGGGGSLGGFGNLQNRNKSHGSTAVESPSLSSLASTLEQPRKSLSYLSSPRSNTSTIESSAIPSLNSSRTSEKAYTQTPHSDATISTTDSAIQADLEGAPHSNLDKTPTQAIDSTSTHSYSATDYQPTEDLEGPSTSIFSPLIATPSHFAISIFEKLNPAPSPIALSTNVLMQSNPKELFNSIRNSSSSSGVITPKRIFQFDTLSPDDLVFKAQSQGIRSVVAASRS
ncbi:hypothetical protein BGZ76_009345 [Entomortierella beljakovae]|nr:hypothetical protein BGZ76_009345 [Entomortierella beljakovae]